jgi:hypothetical protein
MKTNHLMILTCLMIVGFLGCSTPPEPKELALPKIDLFITCKALISKRELERADGTDRVVYSVNVLLEMKNTRGQMMARPISFTGKTKEMRIITGLTGKRLGEEAETKAIREAISDCFNQITLALAQEFPITAQVVGISSFDTDRMLLDKGVMQGLVKGQLVVIWTSDGGIDIPLAEAKVSPGENNSSIQITRWDDSSPGIKSFIKKTKSPGWLKQEANKLYVTTVGLALPPTGRPIELPYNYQNQFSSVQPAVLVTFSKIEMIRGQVPKGIEKGLDSMLEAKLAGMGRFNIFSKFGNKPPPPSKK